MISKEDLNQIHNMIVLIAAAILANSGSGVSNIKDSGPEAQFSTIQEVATLAGFGLYSPNNTARGFSLKSVEIVDAPKNSQLPGLDARKAVRMRFLNKSTSTAFDIYQTKTTSSTSLEKHMKWLTHSSLFEASVSKQDTFAVARRGTTDIAFVGGLVSEPSAQELIRRMVKIDPKK